MLRETGTHPVNAKRQLSVHPQPNGQGAEQAGQVRFETGQSVGRSGDDQGVPRSVCTRVSARRFAADQTWREVAFVDGASHDEYITSYSRLRFFQIPLI